MKVRNLIIVTMSLALGGFVNASPLPPDSNQIVVCDDFAADSAADSTHGWVADERDNIAGIHTLKRVTKPALVNYDELLAVTPQIQEIERKGVDPESAEGRALRRGARTLITKTCEIVRRAEGHCSIWKAIAHKDGRDIPNLTSAVLERL